MEKKTGKTGRFMGWLVSIVLIAVLAWGFVEMYHRMTQEARSQRCVWLMVQKFHAITWL